MAESSVETVVPLRILDLYTNKAVFESESPHAIVDYWREHQDPGHDDWEIQYQHPQAGWRKLPAEVQDYWWQKTREAEQQGKAPSQALADALIAIAKRKYPHRLMPWLDK